MSVTHYFVVAALLIGAAHGVSVNRARDRAERTLTQVDGCTTNPCVNGGWCTPQAAGTFQCSCQTGWGGQRCQDRLPLACDKKPCKNGASCSSYDAYNFMCSCPTGWGGQNCTDVLDVHACESNPCKNNGWCNPAVGGFTCQCQTGFAGKKCEDRMPLACDKNPCKNGASCSSYDAWNFMCSCPTGFGGQNCTDILDTKACDSNPCKNHGWCNAAVNGFMCTCQTGWGGARCENRLPLACDKNPCKNGASCSSYDAYNFMCSCPPGWVGQNCTDSTAAPGSPTGASCKPNPCKNSGQCKLSAGSVTCTCQGNWEGRFCEVAKFKPPTGHTTVPNQAGCLKWADKQEKDRTWAKVATNKLFNRTMGECLMCTGQPGGVFYFKPTVTSKRKYEFGCKLPGRNYQAQSFTV